ncbi:hypothetical protein ACHAW5_007641 [Stephanodiscus triporus]|uniref:Uncharacterized protein n=1 Tax=Stephanodiscus triporus TaxID=2934178 RepID=A0ABD3PGN3_9STRA
MESFTPSPPYSTVRTEILCGKLKSIGIPFQLLPEEPSPTPPDRVNDFLDTNSECRTASSANFESVMTESKRLSLDPLAGSISTQVIPTLASDRHNRRPSTSEPTSNKRQRISFCKTTKLSSPIIIHKPRLPSNMMHLSASCTALPELASSSSVAPTMSGVSTGELDLNVSPATFVRTIVLQCTKGITGSLSGEEIISDALKRVAHESYFLNYCDEHLEAYTHDKVHAVQANDVERLRSLLASGHLMQASNRFGESILHTSCRRGLTDVVSFFLNEARVSPRVRDDMGRTPMHDACWLSGPPNHDIMKMLISAAPEMLLSRDKRGHSPFDYARREYWPNWVAFLNEHREFIVSSLVSTCVEGSDLLTSKVDTTNNEGFRVVG